MERCLFAATILFLLSSGEGVSQHCSEPCLIYSATNKINAMELTSSRTVTFVANLSRAVALDVHVSEKTIYWSDINRRVIQRMNLSSGVIEDIITANLGVVDGLAIEWESGLIYWTDYSYKRVEVATLHGKHRKVLIQGGLSNPRGLALYPKKGFLFLTDWGSSPKIERTTLAGTQRTVLVDLRNATQYWPNAVIVDYTEDRIYWIDAWIDAIESCDLYGKHRRKLTNPIHPFFNMHPFDLTVYDDTLYWSDWNTDSIERLNWTTAAYLGGLGRLTSDRVFGLALLDDSRQPASAGNQLCKVNNGGCSHLCLLTPGGYQCACPDGLALDSQGKTCVTGAEAGCSKPCLIYSATDKINAMELTSSRTVTFVANLSRAVALDVHVSEKTIYWSDINRRVIQRMNLSSGVIEDIITANLGVVDGLAIEWESGLIYWTDYSYKRVEVATLHGKHRKVLIQGGLSNPRGLALYPKKGFLFLTDWGSSPKIERTTLAGTQRTVLVDLRNATQYWPNAVIVDYTEDRIYWIDAWIDAIESCDLYGKHRRKLTNPIHPFFNMHPFDLTVYDDTLYWSDWNTDSIERLNWTTAAYLGGLGRLTSDRVFGLALLDDSRQPASAGNQLCKVNNGGCSHLCLLTPGGYQCACPDGLALDSQGKTCVTGAEAGCSKPCLIYSATDKINAMELTSSRTVTFVANLSRAVALDVHVSEKTIYWSDINRRVIQRMNLSSGVIEDIITANLGVVDGLAIEWESGLIYWTDYSYKRVEVATLHGKHRKVLIQGGLSNPRGLALYPKKGFLFLTDWGSSPKIERTTLAGTQRTVLVDLRNATQYWPNAVIVDYTEDRIYWIDAWIDAIESCDLYGKHRRKLTNPIHPFFNMHPFDLTVYDDTLYWSDWNTDSIERLNWTTAAYLGGLGRLTSDRVFGLALLDDSRQPASAGNQLCKVNNGGCSHLCLLTPGGYQCACPDGLALDSQGKTCVTGAEAGCSKPCLIYSATDKINAMELTSSRTVTFVANLSRAVALDVHVSEKTIYWSDINRRVIQRMNLSSGVIEDIITANLGVVDGLAIEWESGLIYWTDYSYKRVEVATLHGKHRKVLIQGGLSNPRGLALYPKKGFLFLTDWGSSPKIERTTLAGTQRTVLVDLRNATQYWPNAVIVDYTEDRIYWIDAWIDAIESCDLYGKHRRKLTNPIHPFFNMHPFDLTVYDDTLYWSDWNTDSIERLNWTTAAYLGGLGRLTSDRVFGLALLDDSRQPASAGNQLCKVNNGGCSHLCLLTPGGYQCACPDGLALDSQGKTCVTGAEAGCSKPCLIYSATDKINAMELTSSRTVTFVANLSRAVALDVHVSEKTIYWSDINRRVIQRMNLSSGVIEDIITANLGVVDGLAIEWESGLIYWTDYSYKRVEVATLHGKHRKVLIQGGLSNPRGLALYPKKGFLFLTDWGSSPKIERTTLAGTQRTVLVDLRNATQYWPNAVIVDYTEDRIYWIDAWIDAIESCDLYGKHRRKLTNPIHPFFNMHPFDLTVYDDTLYWSDWNTDSIERLNWTTAAYLGGLGRLTSDRVFGLALLDDSRQPASAGNQLCKVNNGGCSHLCLLTPGGYQCACPDGLALDSQGKTCVTGAEAGCSKPCLTYSATDKINAMELTSSRTVTFVANLSRAVALDVHVSEKTIYWSDINRRVIQRMNLSSGVIEDIITANLGVVDGLAIEWESGLIYWTDYSYKRVEVATLHGKHRKVLIQGGLSNPRGLALYPKKGFLFLTDWGSSPKIERTTLAGTQRTVLVDLRNATQYWPNAVIVDYTEDRIYWIDAWIDAIESCDLYGKHRRKLTNPIHPFFNMHPFDLTVYDDTLYWSDWNTDSIERLNWTTAAYLGGLGRLTSDRVFGLALLDDSRQPASAGNQLCKVNNGGCSHLCLLTPGGYQCACPDGLALDSQGKTCVTGAEAGCSKPCLIYSATDKINAMELTSSRTVTFVANLSRAVALDVHVSEKTIYWSDINRRVIQRMNLSSGVIEDIITANLGVVDGLAIEWESGLIYWTDYSYKRVEVATLHGKHRKVLIQGGLSNPRGLALYPKKGFLFLTDWGSSPKIERTTLAGTQRTVLVDLRNATQYWPNAVIVDYTEDRIYWIDAWIDAIESCDLYGKHRRKLTNPIHPFFNMHPFDLTVYDDTLYWSDWNTDSIERLNWTTAAYLGGLGRLTSDRVFGLALLDDSRQPASAGNQLCKVNNGGCSHLCLLTPGGYQCACPDGLALDSQGKTCVTGAEAGCSKPCLIYSATDKINAMELTSSRTVTFVANLSRAVALDVHVSEKTIYWSDINRRVIQRMNLSSGVIEDIITANLGVVDGLAIEWESGLIYWTDYSYKRVEVATLHGKHRKVLIQGGLSNPRGLALYPKKGFLFLTDWGSSPKIERTTLAGTQRTVLVDLRNATQYWPNAVIVDYTEDRIYWIDAWIDAIESCDLYGKHRRKLTNPIHPFFNMHPFDLTVYDDTLYWSDWNTDSIERLNWTTAAYLGGLGRLTSDRVFGLALLDDSRQPASAGNQLCKVNNGGCSHLCLLTPGGYQCACPDGLALDSQGKTCVTGAEAGCSKPCLIYSATDKINAMELTSSRTVTFVANLSRAVALDVHVSEKTIYWSDINRRVIQRMNLSSGVIEDIITANLGVVDGLAIEWESGLIYWTDYSYKRVEVATLHGKHRKVLIQGGLSNPRGLALYPKKGFLFLTDWGSSPKIERTTLAGTQRTVLVDLRNATQYWPNAVIVDYTEDRIYWIDAWIDAIESCDLYGKHRRKLTNPIHPFFNMHPFDLTVYDDTLYWSDWNTDSIERLNWTTAAYLGGLGRLTSDRVFGLALLDDSRQPASAGNQLCKVNNGGCSHLCLLTPGGYECSCPDGLFLDSQGKTCLAGTTLFNLAVSSTTISLLSSPTSLSSLRSTFSASLVTFQTPSPPLKPIVSRTGLTRGSVTTMVASSLGLRFTPASKPVSTSATQTSTTTSTLSKVESSSGSLLTSSSETTSTSVFTTRPLVVSKPILSTVAPGETPSLKASFLRSKEASRLESVTISTTVLQSRVQSVLTWLPGSPSMSASSPTLLPSVGPTATPKPITCRPGTCENGGTCAETTHTCICPQYYIGYDCGIYVGDVVVKIVLRFTKEDQWDELNFKKTIAKESSKFFCEEGSCKSYRLPRAQGQRRGWKRKICEPLMGDAIKWSCEIIMTSPNTGQSKLKSDREKRNSDEEPVYFTPDDVIITRTSFTKENTLEVEFAVLFPASNGKPPRGIPFEEVIKMVEESEDSIQKDLGGSIESISQATKKPSQGPRNNESTQENTSSTSTIVAACVSVAGVTILIAIAVFCWRRSLKRWRQNNQGNNLPFDNTFVNPTYSEDPTYDYISQTPLDDSNSADATTKEALYADLQERRFPQYASYREITHTYDAPSSGGNEKTHPAYAGLQEPHFPQYASLKETTHTYDALSSGGNEKAHHAEEPCYTDVKGECLEDNIYTLPEGQRTSLQAPLVENAPAVNRDMSFSSGEYFSVQAPVSYDYLKLDSIATDGQEEEAGSQVTPQQNGPHYENYGAQSEC